MKNIIIACRAKSWQWMMLIWFFCVFQRQLRHQDAKCVEEKAARIKDWVTEKLQQVYTITIHQSVTLKFLHLHVQPQTLSF